MGCIWKVYRRPGVARWGWRKRVVGDDIGRGREGRGRGRERGHCGLLFSNDVPWSFPWGFF